MIRVKNFNSTGVAPDGRLYAGDLLAIQDAAAGLSDFTQTIDLATLRVGDSGIQLLKFGAADARISAALRTDGILRGLGGLFAGTFTTAQRDAIAAGSRPTGLIIYNTTTARHEVNTGSDAVPNWQSLAPSLGANSITAVELADNAVDTAAIQNAAVTPGKAKLDAAETWNFLGTLLSKSMRVHRHPYGSDRHIESGTLSAGALPNDSNVTIGSVTFTDAFGGVPNLAAVVASASPGDDSAMYASLGATGFTATARNQNNGNTLTYSWIAEGSD